MAIINCPECSSRISSQAYTCPNCNKQIRGHIQQCPNCKEWLFTDTDICPTCNNALEHSSMVQNPTEKTLPLHHRRLQREPKKNRKGCYIALFSILTVFLIICIAFLGLTKYRENKLLEKKTLQEELARRIAEGVKANEARFKQMQMDSTMWAKTFSSKTIAATEEYIKTYPEGIFINEAYMLLEELNRRKVSGFELNQIRNVVETKLSEVKKKQIKKLEKDVLGLHLEIKDELNVTKKYINRDSFIYVVKATILSTINRTDPNKPNKESSKLEILLDSNRKIIESNI